MSGSLSNQSELDRWIDQLLAQVISPEDFAKLQSQLKQSKPARDHYRQVMRVHSALNEAACVTWLSDGNVPIAPLDRPSEALATTERNIAGDASLMATSASATTWRWKWVLLGIAASLIFVFGLLLIARNSTGPGRELLLASLRAGVPVRTIDMSLVPPLPGPATQAQDSNLLEMPRFVRTSPTEVLAVLQDQVGVTWEVGQESPAEGDAIGPGRLKLASGMLKLAFVSGVSVIVQGPADLELLSAERGILHHGQVRCTVPKGAEGFSIDTPGAKYVDLGTEFGLSVSSDGKEEMHVFEGKVQVRSLGEPESPQLVEAGNGLVAVADADGAEKSWQPVPSDPQRFADADQLRRRKEKHDKAQLKRWRSKISKIRNHPDLLVLYDFEPSSDYSQRLLNLADDTSHGTILGCNWSEGRWQGKKALDFKRITDRVQFDVPGEFGQITMTTWVRVDGFDRKFNSLMLTDLFEQGHVHWQFRSSGELDAGIRPSSTEPRQIVLSKQAIGYEDVGRWVHFALVIDQSTATVSHFVNGQCVTRANWLLDVAGSTEPTRTKIQLGRASLGNWNPRRPYDQWLVRNFNGRMDEFAIFSSALSDAEIEDLYQSGKPDSVQF